MVWCDGHTWILHQRLFLKGNGLAYLIRLALLIKIVQPLDEYRIEFHLIDHLGCAHMGLAQ